MAMDPYPDAPSLVLRPPPAPAVQHLLLTVPEKAAGPALDVLARLTPAFGGGPACEGTLSIGLTFAGLVALQLPLRYQRVFRRLAPAFAEGAPRRSQRLGDAGPSAVAHWDEAFRVERAHVLVSLHGAPPWMRWQAQKLLEEWADEVMGPSRVFEGEHLTPPGQAGHWVHFGYRDGISEIVLPDVPDTGVLDPRPHAVGELLLGAPDDGGSNRFALPRLSAKARGFFQGGSFGVFRPMAQDVAMFERQVTAWQRQMSWLAPAGSELPREFVKAKLCGRWPDGQVLEPGSLASTNRGFALPQALARDRLGEGCPFGAHVRRMQPPQAEGRPATARPLQRRSVPFGPPHWDADPEEAPPPRGLLGHFFCASIEKQFEHLVGQWAARPPLGFGAHDRARDPLAGPHEDNGAALEVPIQGRPVQRLRGLGAWTTTLGTLYAWHPAREAWQALLAQDYVPVEDEEPWV